MRQTVVGVFDKMADAQRAADALRQRGIDTSDIHVTASDDGATAGSSSRDDTDDVSLMDRIRNFFSDTVDDDREMSVYSEHVRRGGAVVKVDVEDDTLTEMAREELESAGAVDIDERASQWQASGWSATTPGSSDVGASSLNADADDLSGATPAGRTTSSPPSSASSLSGAAATEPGRSRSGSEEVIPVVQEELQIGKRTVRAGGVRVYARLVEEAVRETVDLREERARVERRPVDRPASESELQAMGERSVEIEETVERPVVQKTARVVEEVVVGKDVRQTTADIEDTVRHTEVEVTDMAQQGSGSLSRRAYEDFDSEFRSDFSRRYGSRERYEDYEPAYRYGHGLAADTRYQGKDWDLVENSARSDWERDNPDSTWERVKASVRHAWNRATS